MQDISVMTIPFEVKGVIESRVYYYLKRTGCTTEQASRQANNALLLSVKQLNAKFPQIDIYSICRDYHLSIN